MELQSQFYSETRPCFVDFVKIKLYYTCAHYSLMQFSLKFVGVFFYNLNHSLILFNDFFYFELCMFQDTVKSVVCHLTKYR